MLQVHPLHLVVLSQSDDTVRGRRMATILVNRNNYGSIKDCDTVPAASSIPGWNGPEPPSLQGGYVAPLQVLPGAYCSHTVERQGRDE